MYLEQGSYEHHRPRCRRSGRKGNWEPDYLDDLPSRRHEWVAQMEQKVIDTAVRLLDEVGPRRFTVKEVARRAGYSRTSLYKHFGLKADLLAQCRDRTAYRLGHRLDGMALAHARRPVRDNPERLRPGAARLRQVLLGLAADLQAPGDLWLLAMAEGARSKRRPLHPRAWEPPSPLPWRLQQVLWRLVAEMQQAGGLPKAIDANELARWLGALWWYELTVRGPQKDPAPPHSDLRERLGTALAWLLRGACAACAA